MKFFVTIIFFIATLSISSASLFAAPNPDKLEFIFMDELEIGMIGEARTVIEGIRIDSFTVELLGIAKDSGFNNRDFLLCKMSGDVIERSGGVAGGMSGSPVYFSGRLAGAVSGHWGYTDQTVGIVTPIEYMLEELEFMKSDIEMEGRNAQKTAWKNRENNSMANATQEIEIVESAEFIPQTDKMVFVKASTPMYIAGIEQKDLELVEPLLNETGNQVFIVPINYPPNIRVPKSFSPGCTVSIPLSRGDISMGGFGTVTWVSKDEKYFLGFGHAMGRRGPCNIPAGTGYIYGVLSSLRRSTKLGVAIDPIGVVKQDRGDAIAGLIGEVPEYIPVKVSTSGPGLKEIIVMRSEITPSWDEYPNVATSVVVASISRSLDNDMTGTLNANTTIKMKIDGKNEWFRRDDIYTGDNTLAQYSEDLKNLMMRIRETDLDLVSIEYIDVTARHQTERLESRIEGMSLLTVDEIKRIAKESVQENNDILDVFDDLERYKDPRIDEDDPEKYILKSGSLYLAAVNLVNYRAPREIVYVPFYLPSDFKNGNGRIIVRSGSGEMPSSHAVGDKVNIYTKTWLKEHIGGIRRLDDGITVYFDRVFESNRGNSLIFEVVHEKYDPAFYDQTKLVRVEIMRASAVKGIWEHPLKVE